MRLHGKPSEQFCSDAERVTEGRSRSRLHGRGASEMTTTTEYRAMAEECFQWARDATTRNARSAYLEIAKMWLAMADARQDGGPPVRYPHIDADAA